MISHGDEIGRTQRGNNNGYCQDNDLTWIDWGAAGSTPTSWSSPARSPRCGPITGVPPAAVLRGQADPRRRPEPRYRLAHPQRRGDDPGDWNSGIKSVAVFLNGEAIPEPDKRGERIVDDSFLMCFNAHAYPVEFITPTASTPDVGPSSSTRSTRTTGNRWFPRARR